jgi:modulator of FtsH protease
VPYVRCARAVRAFTALTDTRFYGLNYNIPSLCFGAKGAAMHGFNEYVELDSLRKSTKATALFIAGFGAAGYATRRDLSALARILFWALIGLILFGIITIFVLIPNAALIYAVLGLVIFAGLTAFDFQRLRRSQDIRTAPLLAASIFLDILNVFLLLLSLFSGSRD